MLPRLLLLILLALGGCASAPPPEPSHVLPVQGTRLDNQISERAAAHPGQSGFHLLGASVDAFLARAELIRKAQRSLDIQYYIVHDGLTTRALIRELLHAADRGVRVRILIDDTSSDGWDYELGALAAHPNIQVRLFNPLHLGRSTGITRNLGRLFNLSEQHRRMHNKLLLADNSVAIVGGRNLGDEYFDAKPEMNFTDLDLMGVGPVAQPAGAELRPVLEQPHQPAHRGLPVGRAGSRRAQSHAPQAGSLPGEGAGEELQLYRPAESQQ